MILNRSPLHRRTIETTATSSSAAAAWRPLPSPRDLDGVTSAVGSTVAGATGSVSAVASVTARPSLAAVAAVDDIITPATTQAVTSAPTVQVSQETLPSQPIIARHRALTLKNVATMLPHDNYDVSTSRCAAVCILASLVAHTCDKIRDSLVTKTYSRSGGSVHLTGERRFAVGFVVGGVAVLAEGGSKEQRVLRVSSKNAARTSAWLAAVPARATSVETPWCVERTIAL